ncbi:hypothetical protein HYH03_001890 [Edaphochlamys debaryana]|uniref:Uncharacterized protein n=1 Tax=Edaphochlamys debaryana TaxID=47281 RepID=A0A835YMC0_9CHLO|nr:hypothetical protein HYH03_001890 [Edaphochlamys debaryana]|eukprot:KAG2500314.1 hypothetical protein HYH03_001890 [Edaphochlamys debaryana]
MGAFEGLLVRMSGRGGAQGGPTQQAPQPPDEGAKAATPVDTAGSQSSATASTASVWEDGTAMRYLLAALAAVPPLVGWARRSRAE